MRGLVAVAILGVQMAVAVAQLPEDTGGDRPARGANPSTAPLSGVEAVLSHKDCSSWEGPWCPVLGGVPENPAVLAIQDAEPGPPAADGSDVRDVLLGRSGDGAPAAGEVMIDLLAGGDGGSILERLVEVVGLATQGSRRPASDTPAEDESGRGSDSEAAGQVGKRPRERNRAGGGASKSEDGGASGGESAQ